MPAGTVPHLFVSWLFPDNRPHIFPGEQTATSAAMRNESRCRGARPCECCVWCASPVSDSQNPREPEVTTGDMSVQSAKLCVPCSRGQSCNLNYPWPSFSAQRQTSHWSLCLACGDSSLGVSTHRAHRARGCALRGHALFLSPSLSCARR